MNKTFVAIQEGGCPIPDPHRQHGDIHLSTKEPWAVKVWDQRDTGDFRHWKKPVEYC